MSLGHCAVSLVNSYTEKLLSHEIFLLESGWFISIQMTKWFCKTWRIHKRYSHFSLSQIYLNSSKFSSALSKTALSQAVSSPFAERSQAIYAVLKINWVIANKLSRLDQMQTQAECRLSNHAVCAQDESVDFNKFKFSYANTKLETSVPVRSLKLSNLGHG